MKVTQQNNLFSQRLQKLNDKEEFTHFFSHHDVPTYSVFCRKSTVLFTSTEFMEFQYSTHAFIFLLFPPYFIQDCKIRANIIPIYSNDTTSQQPTFLALPGREVANNTLQALSANDICLAETATLKHSLEGRSTRHILKWTCNLHLPCGECSKINVGESGKNLFTHIQEEKYVFNQDYTINTCIVSSSKGISHALEQLRVHLPRAAQEQMPLYRSMLLILTKQNKELETISSQHL